MHKKVIKGIKQGNNSTLNSIEEYELAKKILKIEKFADQIKFARVIINNKWCVILIVIVKIPNPMISVFGKYNAETPVIVIKSIIK